MSHFPILMYHALSETPTSEHYTLTDGEFMRQMNVLAELGLQGVSLARLRESEEVDQRRAVVISFDDGHVSNLKVALPILRKFSFSATFFLTTDRIGSAPDWLSWQGAGELLAAGMDIQAHGHTHAFLNDLHGTAKYAELSEPKRLIEQELGARCYGFSFPGGRYDAEDLKLARKLGYEAICTSEPGLNNLAERGTGPLKRFVIHQGLGESTFRRIARGDRLFVMRANFLYKLKRSLKRLLGNRLYHGIWTIVFGKKG